MIGLDFWLVWFILRIHSEDSCGGFRWAVQMGGSGGWLRWMVQIDSSDGGFGRIVQMDSSGE